MSREDLVGVHVPLPPPLRVDIQAALTVIARRKHHDQGDFLQVIDLSYTNLRSADLQSAYLRGANLEGSDLTGAAWISLIFGMQGYAIPTSLQRP